MFYQPLPNYPDGIDLSAETTGNSSIDDSATTNAAGLILVGGDGKNTLKGGDGTDTITGGDKIDSILGGAGADVIDGKQMTPLMAVKAPTESLAVG